jgi:uncharacterized protein (TIGR02996 family)
MSDAGFLRAIQENPADDAARLVYADWLEERGDVRAEYLRAELALARLPADAPEAPALRSRLWRAWAAVDPSWLAVFTQPRLLRANPTPFPAVWKGTGLGRYRPCDSTYCSWPYDTLPDLPVGEFRGEFQWLALARPPQGGRRGSAADPEGRESLQRLVSKVKGQGLRLPESFLRLMASDLLPRAIRSVTDCRFELPVGAVPDPTGGGGFRLTFYCDSQDVLLWDLYVHPSGGHCVIARWPDDDEYEDVDEVEYEDDEDDEDDEPEAPAGPRAWFVAPSFEAFVYRVRLENELWFVAHADFLRRQGRPEPPLTPALQAYLRHYERQGEAPR